jgi:multidrug efflux pump subunit AcrA (membrane-fusion protein)
MEYASIPGLKLLKRYHDWRLSSETKKKRKLFFRWGVPVLILFLILLLPWPLNYSFKCHIRPEVYKSLIVEVAGSVSEVLVDGGAMVKKGEVIARLDDSETLQQWHIAQSEAERMHAQADIDKAGDNPLLAQLSDLKADQAAERAGFLKKQKEKTLLRSPVDGTVLSYDLKRRVGDLLVPGSIFAEVGNLSSWKVQMDVPESEISRLVALIKKQTPLDLAFSLNPLPGKTFHARISGLASVSQTAQVNDLRKNIFRVDAVVEVTPSEGDLLKSGYMGTAKLRGGWRPVGVILLGRFFDYLRLSFVI